MAAVVGYALLAFLAQLLGITATPNSKLNTQLNVKGLFDLQSRLYEQAMRECRNETHVEVASDLYVSAFDKLLTQTRAIHEGYFDGLATILDSPESQETIQNTKQASAGAFAKLESSYRRVVATLKSKQLAMVKENTHEAVEKMKAVQEALKRAVQGIISP